MGNLLVVSTLLCDCSPLWSVTWCEYTRGRHWSVWVRMWLVTPILARKCLEQLGSVRDNVAGEAEIVKSLVAQVCALSALFWLSILVFLRVQVWNVTFYTLTLYTQLHCVHILIVIIWVIIFLQTIHWYIHICLLQNWSLQRFRNCVDDKLSEMQIK